MGEYMTLIDAAKYLGVARETLNKIIGRGELAVTTSPLDRRVKLVMVSDLDALKATPRQARKAN